MGWCPGIDAAARFVPDIEIPRSVTITSVIISLTIIILANSAIPLLFREEAGPLEIIIDGEVFYDEMFTEDFNYSSLVRRERGFKIYFLEPVDPEEFADEVKIEYFQVESLRDVWNTLDRLKMPNIVRGFARLICDGRYDELTKIFFDGGPRVGIQVLLGGGKGGVTYHIQRTPAAEDRVERIRISKQYSVTPTSGASIWVLEVKVYSLPPFEVTLKRYPRWAPRS
ncbi:hypothetical protein KEJ49_05350 [Candidatus Bathyarchaeota archaeon]|nr:hypothetical protein [Candidatus Bathyarchaeota archaeon]